MNTSSLNGLRFFGAFIIACIFHYPAFYSVVSPPFGSIFTWSYPFGYLMVELFFIISGFGMYNGYILKLRTNNIDLWVYLKKRLMKIYPEYLLALVIVTVCNIVRGEGEFFDLWHFLLNLFLCQYGLLGMENSFNLPAWCISVFFFNYILFYAIVKISKNNEKCIFYIVLYFLFGIIMFNAQINFPTIFNKAVARGAMAFSVGCFLSFIHQKKVLNEKNVGWASSLLLLVLYYIYRFGIIIGNMDLVFVTVIGPLIIFSTLYCPLFYSILSSRIMQVLGASSMTIFFFHYPIRLIMTIVESKFSLTPQWNSHVMWFINVFIIIGMSLLYDKMIKKHYRIILKYFLDYTRRVFIEPRKNSSY